MKKINVDLFDTDVRYGNLLKQLCDWIDAWMLFIVSGRGTAKSSEILSERLVHIIFDMPGAPLALLADSYVNLDANILPAIQLGWQRKNYYEGRDYVIGKRPPDEWLRKCSIVVSSFKNTLFWFNGTVIFKGSLDRPSLLAGKSVVHVVSDEVKYQADKKIARTFPILRGDSTVYGDSNYFLGITATTDMPDINEGEYDWILNYAKKMDKDAILKIIDAFYYLNEARINLYNARKANAPETEIHRLEKEIAEWEARVKKVRHEKVFFFNSSSLMNIEILTLKYLRGLIESLETEDFNKSVLGLRPSLKKSQRFYIHLNENHFYIDGYDYEYYDTQNEIKQNALGLKYLRRDEKIEGGLDVGNMISLAIGQQQGSIYRILKGLYVIPPNWFRELADDFLTFFRSHNCKVLDLYYDRSANNFSQQGQDFATKFKDSIEKDANGNRTGWQVNLLSRGQGNLSMSLEYDFMVELLQENNLNLPKLRIDKFNCKEIKSSLEKAPAGIEVRNGKKRIIKVKKSERLEPRRLPMESTNFSDAVKYLLMRPLYLSKIRKKTKSNISVDVLN